MSLLVEGRPGVAPGLPASWGLLDLCETPATAGWGGCIPLLSAETYFIGAPHSCLDLTAAGVEPASSSAHDSTKSGSRCALPAELRRLVGASRYATLHRNRLQLLHSAGPLFPPNSCVSRAEGLPAWPQEGALNPAPGRRKLCPEAKAAACAAYAACPGLARPCRFITPAGRHQGALQMGGEEAGRPWEPAGMLSPALRGKPRLQHDLGPSETARRGWW